MSDKQAPIEENSPSILGTGLKQAMSLGALALIAGGASGWLGTILTKDLDGMATIVTYAYLSLVVIWPLFLVAMTVMNLDEEIRTLYATFGGSIGILLTAGIVGSVLGTAFFFVPATNIPALLGVAEPAGVQQALFAHIGWGKVIVNVLVTCAVALITAIWANRQARGQQA